MLSVVTGRTLTGLTIDSHMDKPMYLAMFLIKTIEDGPD